MLTGDEIKDLLYLLPIALEGAHVGGEIIRVAVALNDYQVLAREHRFTVSVLSTFPRPPKGYDIESGFQLL